MFEHRKNLVLPVAIGGVFSGLIATADWRAAIVCFAIYVPIGVCVCYAVDWRHARRHNAFD